MRSRTQRALDDLEREKTKSTTRAAARAKDLGAKLIALGFSSNGAFSRSRRTSSSVSFTMRSFVALVTWASVFRRRIRLGLRSFSRLTGVSGLYVACVEPLLTLY